MKDNASLGWHGTPGCVPVSNSVPSGRKELVGGLMDASSLELVRMALDHTHDLVVHIMLMTLNRSTREASWTPLT